MGGRTPGPVCSSRVEGQWIDLGTSCRTRTDKPGPTEIARAFLIAAAGILSPAKAQFDRDHIYSMAPEAARKRDIDLQIIGDDYSRSAEIRIDSEDYLKQLIVLGSRGKTAVATNASKIQFFIIRGGGEGFMSPSMATKNANDLVTSSSSTGSASTSDSHFDINDVLAAFDPKGKLIGAAFLQRPTYISGIWSTKTANDIYNAWNNKGVSIYRNTTFEVPYLGLVVDDGMKSRGWVDMHKQEQTNGCIFIVDPATPALNTEQLNTFEPKLLIDVLAKIGKTPEQIKGAVSLGKMHLVDM